MPFSKGSSGNPGGRPKDRPFAEALRMEIKASGNDHRALRQIARALLAKAAEGDLQAIREVADRLDGKLGLAETAVGHGTMHVYVNTGIIRPGDEAYRGPLFGRESALIEDNSH